MGRWAPDARGRLGQAAMDLYAERGYDAVTVADIAERAGLTSRTFFRYFGDKPEVLFAGAGEMHELFEAAVRDADDSAAPLDIAFAAFDAVSRRIGDDRTHSRERQAIIDAHAALRERELTKLTSWSAVLAGALKARGVPDFEADLAAETGSAVFRVAFARWLSATSTQSLARTVERAFAQLRAMSS